MKPDRVFEIKDTLAKIARQDTSLIISINVAMRRMAELGLEPEAVRGLLKSEPGGEDVSEAHTKPFHGFASRYQASLAALAGLPKQGWPSAYQGAFERVNTILKNQKPETSGDDGQGLIIVSVAAPVVASVQDVKSFRRLRSGKLRELTATEEPVEEAPVIDVEVKVAK